MTDAVAHRLRLLDELHAAGLRAWGADFLALPLDDYRDAMICLALDRIHAGETRGFARRRPALPVILDAARMSQGIG